VGSVLQHARAAGALTALVTSNPAAPLAPLADHVLVADTGAEAITGSTRLKAGTAQKLILNTFSTALMVRLGRTFSNLMIDLQATNAKLRGRAITLLAQATGLPDQDCQNALQLCGDLKTALVYLLAADKGAPAAPQACRQALETTGGRVRQAVDSLIGPAAPGGAA
jgi:N-acetylmuramic acid 6-phosphate etherase